MGEKFPRFSLVMKYTFIFHIADEKYHKFVCVLLRPSCVSLFPTWLLWTMVWASCLSSTHLLLSPMHFLINLCTLRWERKPFYLAISLHNITIVTLDKFFSSSFVPECLDCWKQPQLQLLGHFVQQWFQYFKQWRSPSTSTSKRYSWITPHSTSMK